MSVPGPFAALSRPLVAVYKCCGFGMSRQDGPERKSGSMLQRLALRIADHLVFGALVQLMILASSVALILELPGTLSTDAAKPVLAVLELVFTAFFTGELAFKLVAYGPVGYIMNGGNILDLFVVIVSWLSYSLSDLNLDFLRALRSIRMLKLAALHEGMRIAISSMYLSLPAVGTVLLVLLLALVIFGILGMQSNAGRWGFCDTDILDGGGPYEATNRTFTVFSKAECHALQPPGNWINPTWGHFDDIFSSMLILFETSTLEQWPDIFVYMADASWDQARDLFTPPVPAPDNTISAFASVYWLLWIFVSAFVIENLFVGVIVETFQRHRQRNDGTIFLTEGQKKWLLVMSIITQKASHRVRSVPYKGYLLWIKRPIYLLVTSTKFEVAVMVAILASVIVMAMESYSMSPEFKLINLLLYYIFCGIFVVELFLKWLGLGLKKYFLDSWNCFDFILVVFSIADIILEAQNIDLSATGGIDPVFFRIFRLVRIVRLVRLIRGFRDIQHLIRTVVTSIPALINIMALMVLLMIIYAIAGVSLFHGVMPVGAQFLDYNVGGYVSFQSLGAALLTLFRCVTGESWNGIMHDLMINDVESPRQCSGATPPATCGNPFAAILYFVSFTVLATFMLLNLLIAFVLQNFSNKLSAGPKCISVEQIEEFTNVWQLYDPFGTQMMSSQKLPFFLHALKATTWVYDRGAEYTSSLIEATELIKRLKVPLHKGKVTFQETIQALARAVHHGYAADKVDEMVELESAGTTTKLPTGCSSAEAEVARARVRMRHQLQDMQKAGYRRTGLLKKSVKPHRQAAAASYSARLVQMRWKTVCMHTALTHLIDRGDVLASQWRAYSVAISVIEAIWKVRLDNRTRKNLLNRVDRLATRIVAPSAPKVKTVPQEVLHKNPDFVRAAAEAERKAMERAPMTTIYACHLMQSKWRTNLEKRAYIWLKSRIRLIQEWWRSKLRKRALLQPRSKTVATPDPTESDVSHSDESDELDQHVELYGASLGSDPDPAAQGEHVTGAIPETFPFETSPTRKRSKSRRRSSTRRG